MIFVRRSIFDYVCAKRAEREKWHLPKATIASTRFSEDEDTNCSSR